MKAGSGQEFETEQALERPTKKPNSLPIWGNEKSMNLNPLILTNIQSSQYFKVNLYQLKTYHEVIDEIYYQVSHLEPWEKGSRKTSGQTGMCGGVRGVGAGGIVSTAFCILYKLFTLKLTRKQVQGLINHTDSPYIRGLGFMYIRYTQPPADLWEWLEPYLDDEEEIDVRAGGGQTTTIGTIVRHMLTKLEWHATLFPRIPVPIQKDLEKKLSDRAPVRSGQPTDTAGEKYGREDKDYNDRDRWRDESNGYYRGSKDRETERERSRDKERARERDRDRDRSRQRSRERDRERDRHKHRDPDRDRRKKHRDHRHSRSRHSGRSSHEENRRERDRSKKERRHARSRSRDRERRHRH